MASSRASTPAGRRRTTQRASATTQPRSRSGTKRAAKPAKARTPAQKPKPRAKVPAAKAKRPARPAAGKRGRLWPVLIAAVALLASLAAAYFLWFRDSSFVAVESVKVEGIEGPEREEVIAALQEEGSTMTTLHISEEDLGAAVAGFPTVVGIRTQTDLPHGLTVEVTDRPPVLDASSGGRTAAIAGDGTVLTGVDTGGERLPSFEVEKLPGSGTLEGKALEVARIAGAAPAPLLPLIDGFDAQDPENFEVDLRGGLPVYFGGSDRAEEKWDAIAVILANPNIDTLTHLDVRAPERPAVGGAATPDEETATEVPDSTTFTP